MRRGQQAAAAAPADPEAGAGVGGPQHPPPQQRISGSTSPPPTGPVSGPTPGPFARWIRKVHVSRGMQAGNAAQAYSYYGAKPQTIAEHKLVAQYNSQAAVLGSSAAAQINQFKFDDVGRRQVEVEERFVLQRGIIHPYNRVFRAWWWLTIIAAAVTGWLIPYTIAFLPRADGPGSVAYRLEACLLAIFLVDMASSFFVARYDKGVLIGDRRTLIKIYLRFRFWWDILTVLPWDWIVLSAMGLLGSNTVKARFVSLLGLLKLGRMYRIDRLYRHLEFSLALPLIVTKLTRIATYSFYLIHWAGCAFWFIAHQEQALGYSSWLTAINEGSEKGIEIESLSTWEKYTYSVWWAASTFYPVGAGHNIAPYTLAEVIFTMVFMALNVLMWGFILGSISLLVARSDEQSAKYRQRMHALERYGRDKGLPQDLKELIEGHLRLNFTTNEEADEQMLATLPTTLRRRILRYLYGEHLRRCWLLSDVKPKFFDALLGVARLETFMPQVEIFSEGDEVNELYFIVAGYVEVFASAAQAEQSDKESLNNAALYSRSPSALMNDVSVGKHNAAGGTGYVLLGPSDVVGEVAFFTEVPQLEVVRTLTVCRALVVPRPAYAALAADFPMSATAMLVALQKSAERAVSAEFRGGAASRLLRGSLVASLPGLTFQQASAETMGESKAVGGGGGAAAGGAPSPPPGGNVPRAVAVAAAAAAGAGLGGGSSPEPGSKDNLLSGQNSVGGLTLRQQQVIGNLQRIRAVVKHHVAQADESRTGQFLSAAAKGQVDRVKLLLQQGYHASTADYDKRTALMLAAGNGHKAVVDMLLSVSVNVNARDQQGNTALLEAARNGHSDIITALMARGARLNLDGQGQAQVLCSAITRGDIPTLHNLLRCGADANSLDYDRRAPLHIAAADGNLQAVKVLVEEGKARVDIKSRNGNTPLDAAHTATATAVVAYLESKVSAHEAATARKKAAARRADALLRACTLGDAAAVQSILDAGCPPNACDYDKRTGLMLAAANGHREVVSLLLAAGSNPNARDNLGGSALLEAVKGGWDELIQLLMGAGGSLLLSGCELASALCAMVQEEQPHLLRRYIAAGADVNAADYDKRTPLHIAAAEAKLGLVVLLVAEGGADLAAADRWGNTPLAEATRVGARDVVAYLKSDEAKQAAVKARQAAADRLQASRRYGMRPSAAGCSSPVAGGSAPSSPTRDAFAAPSASVSEGGATATAAGGGSTLTPLQRAAASSAGGGGGGGATIGAASGSTSMSRVRSGDEAINEAVRFFDAEDG